MSLVISWGKIVSGNSYSDYKDSEVEECLRLAKRPTKCHEQGEKWQEMGVRIYLEPDKVGSNRLQ